jgi:hypothetical protein
MNVRFKTRSREAAVLRGPWRKEDANWRITPTTLSNRDQQGMPVLLKRPPVDLNDDKSGM